MKSALFLVAFFLHLCLFGASDNNTPNPGVKSVQCRILDASTGEALTGVQITSENSKQTVWSDETGLFTLELPADEPVVFTVSLVSFQTLTFDTALISQQPVIYLQER
jgi:hypothetical protein